MTLESGCGKWVVGRRYGCSTETRDSVTLRKGDPRSTCVLFPYGSSSECAPAQSFHCVLYWPPAFVLWLESWKRLMEERCRRSCSPLRFLTIGPMGAVRLFISCNNNTCLSMKGMDFKSVKFGNSNVDPGWKNRFEYSVTASKTITRFSL